MRSSEVFKFICYFGIQNFIFIYHRLLHYLILYRWIIYYILIVVVYGIFHTHVSAFILIYVPYCEQQEGCGNVASTSAQHAAAGDG